MAFLHYVTILAVLSTPVWSYSSGAPPSGCTTLGPKHPGIEPKGGAAPYKLTLTRSSVPASEALEIQLSATGAQDIQGFMVQAQVDGKPVGTFSAENSGGLAQILQCTTGQNDTITHTKIKELKVKSVNFLWVPSANLKGKTVKLVGTVAAGYDAYWLKGVKADIKIV